MSGFVWFDFAALPCGCYSFNLVWSGIAVLTLYVLVCLIVWYGLNFPVVLHGFAPVWSWLLYPLFIPFTTFYHLLIPLNAFFILFSPVFLL